MSVFDDIRRGFEQIPKGFQELPDHLKHIPDQIQHETGLDPHQIQDWIHHEAQIVLQSAAGEIAEAAFKKSAELAEASYRKLKTFHDNHPDLIDEINKVDISVFLSLVKFNYDNFYSRAEGLTKLLSEQAQVFALTRSFIKNILVNTLPTSVEIDISGQLGVSALKAGVQFKGPVALMAELTDEALEKMGVPP